VILSGVVGLFAFLRGNKAPGPQSRTTAKTNQTNPRRRVHPACVAYLAGEATDDKGHDGAEEQTRRQTGRQRPPRAA
jgi:hypothetical protein